MLPLPNIVQSFVDQALQIKSPWIQYLQQFTIAPPAFLIIDASGSPFEYEAKEPGNIFISGGIVSDISLTRGPDTIILFPDTSVARFVPVAVNDIVSITYSVKPIIKFIPSYGQNTTS